ncbi:MAG: methanogenesis marker 2 protein [Acidimicrobiales bacterium]
MAQKASIAMVREVLGAGDWLAGPGDDGALVQAPGPGGGTAGVIVCGEAIFPPFVAGDPYGAGIAAVLTNVNDLAAMGAVPLAIVDTVTGDEAHCRAALAGMRDASLMYAVPIVGGHLTISDGPPSLSAFGVGSCPVPLSASSAAPGQRLGLLACLEGEMREDFPFFRSFEQREGRLDGDVRLLAELAGTGACVAAKDVSMAGLLGSLAMLLEPSRCGVTLELDGLPCPEGVDLERWLIAFPCFAFLVCSPVDRVDACRGAAERRGLSYTELGTLDDSGLLRVGDGSDCVTVCDVGRVDITGLRAR